MDQIFTVELVHKRSVYDDSKAPVERRTALAVSRILSRTPASDRAVQLTSARQRPYVVVHQRRDGAVQGCVPRQGTAQLSVRGELTALRSRRRQAQRSGECRLHRTAPHLLRDAGEFQLRRLF